MPAQIYEPHVSRNYRIEIDGNTFIGRCVGWDQESVFFICDPALNEGVEVPTHQINLKRTEIKMSEWH